MRHSISDEQLMVHVFTEALAVGVFVPWLFSQSANHELPKRDRAIAFTMGTATLLVDGWLLAQNLTKISKGK